MRYKLFNVQSALEHIDGETKLKMTTTLLEEGELEMGKEYRADTPSVLSIEAAPNVWLNFSTSEWGQVEVEDCPPDVGVMVE